MSDTRQKNFDRYKEHLAQSSEGVQKVGKWLREKGYEVQIPELRIAPSLAKYDDFVDDGDIFLNVKVEVKRRSFHFTCAKDFPYKEGSIVCAKKRFDKCFPQPFAIIHLNKKMTHCAIIMKNTKKHWIEKMIKDGRYTDYYQVNYVCPLEYIEWARLT